jgi:outer membrane receptor protein involved in Fe transport
MKTRFLMSCAAVAVLSMGTAAFAEDTSKSAPTANKAAPESSFGGDIVVTAQRRDEKLSDVPLTVQAISGRELSQLNATSFSDLLKYTPNVTFGNNGPGQGAIFIRGLSAGFAGNQSSGTIAQFPNVALFLDEQSLQFPARNADVYLADMERVEVLEGPQGTLFGGSAEAGAVRYITNKPNTHKIEGNVQGSFGGTAGGGANYGFDAMINLPIIQDKLALRVVAYGDHHGGYIQNVASTFTRNNSDPGIYQLGITPATAGGLCPNGLPAGPVASGVKNGSCAPLDNKQYSNAAIAGANSNPVDTTGFRAALKYDISPDWDILVAESYQDLNAQGTSTSYPTGSDFQTLGPLQNTVFVPTYNKDTYWNTAWTVNGKIGDFKLIYTGGYTVRNISEQMDYSNYSRTGSGVYYTCVGGGTGWGTGPGQCYSPITYWHDTIRNTHQSHEFRVTSPDSFPLHVIAGAYWERFKIQDNMNFEYKNIPSCTPQNYAIAVAGGGSASTVCVANVIPNPASTSNDPSVRDNNDGFGEDTQRGYDQLAFFGSADYDIIPKVLTLSGGTRYYKYTEYEVGSQYGTGTGCANKPNGLPNCVAGVNIDAANDHVTYTGFKSRGEITWHFKPNSIAYFLFSQGFRPGGFNRSSNQVAPIGVDASGKALANGVTGAVKTINQFQKPNGYSPDSLDNFEIGLKTELFDRKLQLNLSAYLMNWRNVQLNFYNPSAGLGNTSFALNGPNYRVKGLEVQFVGRPTRALTIQGSFTYNDNQQTNSPCFVSTVTGSPTVGGCVTQVYSKSAGANIAFGNPFGAPGTVAAFAPHFQGDIRGRYNWAFENGMKAFVGAGIVYTSAEYNQPATYPSGEGVIIPGTTLLRYRQDGYAVIDASAGLSMDRWSFQVFGSNLANSHASTFTSSTQYIKSEVPLRPLVFGIKIGSKF